MSGSRQPIELVIARGKKNLTKAEIAERRATEVKPIADNIVAPSYLTKKQTEDFYKIAGQLLKLKILGETDVDTLARYVTANDLYITAVRKMRSRDVKNDPIAFGAWAKVQERYFKQCRSCASDLGLSISSRCKLVVPETNEPSKKQNKFSQFEKRGSAVNE